MLGDLNIAEPGALIGFAGPRVIEQTIRQKLPDGFQRSEFLLEHGMLDAVVHRRDSKGFHRPRLRLHGCGRQPPVAGMTYQQAVAQLYQLGHELAQTPSHKFDLQHMRVLLRALGHPERRFRSVLIAGTNGKGSTAATLESIVRAAGYKHGTLHLAPPYPCQRTHSS